jgi:hypothetical protein
MNTNLLKIDKFPPNKNQPEMNITIIISTNKIRFFKPKQIQLE